MTPTEARDLRIRRLYDPDATTGVKVKNGNYTQARDRHELFERRVAGGR